MEVKILVKWAPLMCTFWGRGCFYIFWGVLIAGAGGVAFAVLGWAVTKAGSRRRRGYNVDSSWTEAALSRWLVPHGRSAS